MDGHVTICEKSVLTVKNSFSSPEPVVSWSRGRLQIKLSGSGDENGKALGSILLRHRTEKKKYPDLASARFRTHSIFKNVHSSKSCGFVCRIHQIRVDGSCIRKELLRFKKHLDTCGRGLNYISFLLPCNFQALSRKVYIRHEFLAR